MSGSDDVADAESGASEPDSVRPIRALMRGLEALQELNRRNGVTVTDIAKAIGLPRTTAYRMLETLCVQGLAFRDPADERYRLTAKVRTLADGCDHEPWINAIARPILLKQARELIWPVSIATLHGLTLLSREMSGKDSADGAVTPHTRLALLTTSAGRIFLAYCGEEQRAALLDVLTRSDHPDDGLARDKSLLNRILAEARSNGWAICDDSESAEFDLAAPITARSRILATVSVRVTRSAMTPEEAVEKYLPLLKRIGAEVGEAFENYPQPAS
jgi:IclR family mhp operon transcriptional activator